MASVFRTPKKAKIDIETLVGNSTFVRKQKSPPRVDILPTSCCDVSGAAGKAEARGDASPRAASEEGRVRLHDKSKRPVPVRLNLSPSPGAETDAGTSETRTGVVPDAGTENTKNKNEKETYQGKQNPRIVASPAERAQALLNQAKASHRDAREEMKKSGNLKREIKAQVEKSLGDMLQVVNILVTLVMSNPEGEKVCGSDKPRRSLVLEPGQTMVDGLMEAMGETNERLAECALYTRTLSEQIKKVEKGSGSFPPKHHEEPDHQAPRTYAKVAAAVPQPMHSIIVSSTDALDTSNTLVEKIRAAVDAKETRIRVDKVRKARDQKVVVGCHNPKELEAVKSRLSDPSSGFKIENAVNKDPLVVLLDVMKYNTDDDITKAIKVQNAHLLEGLDPEDIRAAVKYRRRARNALENHVVVQVSPPVWQRLTGAGRAHVDLQRVFVSDQSPLIQCSRCLGFGHGKKLCTEEGDKCSHCGDLGHLRVTCPSRLAGGPPRCKNCSTSKMVDTEHDAFSSRCPANLQRMKLATEELMQEATSKKIAVALIQEPYVGGAKKMGSYRGVRIFQNTTPGEGTVKAAIAVYNNTLAVTQCPELTTNNIVVVKIQTSAWEITLASLYFEPNLPIEPYLEQLKRMNPRSFKNLIVGGDVNAKSIWWGSAITDSRGESLASTLDQMNLQVLNTGDTPTFEVVRGGKLYSSHVDVTACAPETLNLVHRWRVDQGVTNSDHNAIIFNIRLKRGESNITQRTTRRFNTKKANWHEFREKLGQLIAEKEISPTKINTITNTEHLENIIHNYTDSIHSACTEHIPPIKNTHRLTLPWWSEEMANLKKEVLTWKRRIRCAAIPRKPAVVEQYLQKKKDYEIRAKHEQIKSWKEFCGKQDKEGLWEGIYRVIGRTTKRQEDVPLTNKGEFLSLKESVKLLAETFYPEDKETGENAEHQAIRRLAETVNGGSHDNHDPPFTIQEVKMAVESLNPKKAPGADGFTADICAQTISRDPDTYLSILNKCLQLGHFPKPWKQATVVVLKKPGKDDYSQAKSYRPVGLLPVLGKIYEKLIMGRIKWHILPKLSPRQYGFMPQKSTEDSLYDLMKYIRGKLKEKKLIVMISLDIEGAFDSAWWPAIRVRLAEEGCPINLRKVIDSYLQNRRVEIRYGGEAHSISTNKGCVQGSIGGPILWNLLLDPLLKGLTERGDYCQAFADDVVLVMDGDVASEVQRRANAALAYVREWGIRNKLKFAPQKTKAMLITRKLKYDEPLLSMGGVDIEMSKDIKLLGLTIDSCLTFNKHIQEKCSKVVNIYRQLSRAAKVSWGLHPEVIRTIYSAVIEPIVMYAASAWAPAASKLGVKKQLNAIQRGFAQKLCKAHRTVSLNAALLLAGLLPLDIRIREAAALYEMRRGLPRPEMADREIERRAGWNENGHPATHMSHEFISLIDQEEVSRNSAHDIRIFTDGSKIENKVGASLSQWDREQEIRTTKLKLPSHCTVYQAELLAICRATTVIVRSPQQSFGIYSDSRSALETIRNNGSQHPLAVEARRNLRKGFAQGKDVILYWVKAHAGLVGNERADELAKEAALHLKKAPDYSKCPVSFVKGQIRTGSLDEWNRRYKTGETAGTTKVYFPDATEAYRIIIKMKMDTVMAQLLTGHGGFSEYLTRFKCKENPSCICDPAEQETVLHLLTECPEFAESRRETEQQLELKIETENIENIMKKSKARKIFIKFGRNVVSKVIKRNK